MSEAIRPAVVMIVLFTILTLLPALLLSMTPFVRILIVQRIKHRALFFPQASARFVQRDRNQPWPPAVDGPSGDRRQDRHRLPGHRLGSGRQRRDEAVTTLGDGLDVANVR